MDAVLTSLAFGFGGWIGVFGSTFLFLNVPHTYTLLTMLLSPWIGGISLYLLMFATHAWINVSVQVAQAMTKYEIIMAVLTSCIGVLIVAIARLIITMERGHRTPAQAAAEEAPPSPPSSERQNNSSDSDESNDEGIIADDEGGGTAHSSESSSDSESEDQNNGDSDEGEGDEGAGDDTDNAESDNDEESDSDEKEDGSDDLNKAVIEDSSTSSYENINTPQLATLSMKDTSPIPKIPDI